MSILDEMKVRRLYCDGGMGSLLQAAGLAAGELPERWNISHPEVITDVHRKYLAAGADIMTTNTFGANREKLRRTGCRLCSKDPGRTSLSSLCGMQPRMHGPRHPEPGSALYPEPGTGQ